MHVAAGRRRRSRRVRALPAVPLAGRAPGARPDHEGRITHLWRRPRMAADAQPGEAPETRVPVSSGVGSPLSAGFMVLSRRSQIHGPGGVSAMKYLSRATVVVAVVAAAMVPMASASAGRSSGDHGHGQKAGQAHGHGHGHGHGKADPTGRGHKSFRILIFSKTAAFRHTECIPSGTVAIAQMGLRNGFAVDATENTGDINDANLARYDAVVFLCTTGDVLNDTQQAAFERYIKAGHGYVGIHSASDTEYDWAWYGGLVGADFRDHPGGARVNQQFQVATVNVEDRNTAATRHLPARWTREEEWYNFRTSPRNAVHVLMSVDEKTYDPRGYSVSGGSTPMGDHPIAWCHRYDGGRSFYTALGHKGVYWKEPLLLAHVLGGIEMAAGRAPFNNCG